MRINLIKEREKSKWTKNSISQRLGITVRQYDRLEAGTSGGRIEHWETLSKTFNKSINYLIENNSTVESAGTQTTVKGN